MVSAAAVASALYVPATAHANTALPPGGHATAGAAEVRKVARFAGFDAGPEPSWYDGWRRLSGRLVADVDGVAYGLAGVRVFVEFSTNGTDWTRVTSQTTSADGTFDMTTVGTEDGYWRAQYPGNNEYTPAVSGSDYVDVKYRTSIQYYNASPEPVKKGAYITVKGLLYRYMPAGKPGPGANIHIYFRPKGSSTWTKMAITKTATNGWFNKKFKASQDGTWLARYWGSSTYVGSNQPADYVDVR
ncbi:hypothetical protein [Actinomadura livida]|uniref:Carboxypeptidase regulatory-like domain-containing protein n=1 Tax=Actinomadura livida TaxID=79909 RepID=A0A7W7MVD6_9ACTN|nr:MULTISPECIES: hypothetical protein [Actinomadura]MBB4771649.1 hypothetical protein [Actinomadura catellatispora]